MWQLFDQPASLALSLAPFGRAFSSREIYSAMLGTLWLGALVAVLGATLALLVVAALALGLAGIGKLARLGFGGRRGC